MSRPRNIGKEIIAGLSEFVEAGERGLKLEEKFNVRKVQLKSRASRYTSNRVKKVRNQLNASQAVFAQFLGVAPATVRAWECGNNVPSGLAARFLDEIQENPDFFRARMQHLLVPKDRAKNAV
jgi:putative transcriptional regulator